MATRRNVKTEDIARSEGPAVAAPKAAPAAVAVGGASNSVIVKLLLFTAAMIIAPLGTYYVSVTKLFVGQSTVAGALAAVMANVVLIAYVIVAVSEDSAEAAADKKSQ